VWGPVSRMNIWLQKTMVLVGVSLASALSASGQEVAVLSADSRTSLLSSPPAAGTEPTLVDVVREIADPHTGDRWLLRRDGNCPGGPGRLLLVPRAGRTDHQSKPGDIQSGVAQAPGRTQFIPVIRAGDLLVIEESTTVADARLEAVALGPATAGSPLNVRLKIGGKLVRAIALSPGRAAFAREEVER